MYKEKDLTTGSLWKQILFFSLPLMVSNILQVLFNMSDIAVVGKFSGEIALGAVGSTTTLVTLFTGFLIGLGNGVNVVVARFLGEKKYHPSCFYIFYNKYCFRCDYFSNWIILFTFFSRTNSYKR